MEKDYALLQEGNDWTVLHWNPLTGSWVKTVTFYYDSWRVTTRLAAEDYISTRRDANRLRSEFFLKELEVGND